MCLCIHLCILVLMACVMCVCNNISNLCQWRNGHNILMANQCQLMCNVSLNVCNVNNGNQ
jgi:hypothetical protein